MADKEQQVRSNVFTDDGRLLQAEYAVKNVRNAGTIAGLACTDGVVLVGVNPSSYSTIEKIYKLSDDVYCAVAGVFGDALRLIKFARLDAVRTEEAICAPVRLSEICRSVAYRKQRNTHFGGTRPFGVSIMFAGYEDSEYALYSTDPSGTVNRWRAWSFGSNEGAINSGLKNTPPPEGVRVEEGVKYLLEIMGKAKEFNPDIANRMEVLLFQKENTRMMTRGEVRALLEALQQNISEN